MYGLESETWEVFFIAIREVFKNPSNGNFPLRGYPPPLSGLRLAEKLTEIS